MSEDLIAGTAVALVGAYLKSSDDTEPAPVRNRLEGLNGLIHDKLRSKGDYANALLNDVERFPAEPGPQVALAAVVAHEVVDDPQFRVTLEQLVWDAVADDAVVEMAERTGVGPGPDYVKRFREQ